MWQIAPTGDRALLVRLGDSIDPALLGQVLALEKALTRQRPRGLLGTVPAYASLLCRYDPDLTDERRLTDVIRECEPLAASAAAALPVGDIAEVPTRYDGPDLANVASATGLTPEEVIGLHAGREYLVYCVGFAPGFTYCGALPETLMLPRRASPRLHVPAGSVGIAGRQTGIYAVDSPGGWNLIGRTEMRLFDPTADPPTRFKPGDRIRFVPAS